MVTGLGLDDHFAVFQLPDEVLTNCFVFRLDSVVPQSRGIAHRPSLSSLNNIRNARTLKSDPALSCGAPFSSAFCPMAEGRWTPRFTPASSPVDLNSMCRRTKHWTRRLLVQLLYHVLIYVLGSVPTES